MSETPSILVSNNTTNTVSYDLTTTTNKITRLQLFLQWRFVGGAMFRCCGSNFGFSILRYNLLDDSATAIALERIDLNFKNDAKTTESIDPIVDSKLEHHLFLRWPVNRIASQKVLQKKC